MVLKESQKKDLIIKWLNEKSNREASHMYEQVKNIFGRENIKDTSEIKYLLGKIEKDNLIVFNGRNFKYKYEIENFILNGGYKGVEEKISLKEEAKIKKQKELEFQDKMKLEKLKWDTKLSKWQVKTFWWFFFIAIVGSILGTISFFMQLNSK